jgi:hypothetical protein
MSRTSNTIALVSLLACCGQALAQAGSPPVIVGGIDHAPLGDTLVEAVTYEPLRGGSVTFSSQAGSSRFRATWPLLPDGSSTGGLCDFACESSSLHSTPTLIQAVCFVGGTPFARLTEVESSLGVQCDFVLFGAEEVEWQALSASGDVVASGRSSGDIRLVHAPLAGAARYGSGGGAGKATFSDLSFFKRVSTVGPFTVLAGGVPTEVAQAELFTLRTIRCITSPCPGDGLGAITMEVSSNRRRVEVLKSNRTVSSDASRLLADGSPLVFASTTGGAAMVHCCDSDGDGLGDGDTFSVSDNTAFSDAGAPGIQWLHGAPVGGVSFRKQYVGHVTLMKRTASTGASQRCIVDENPVTGAVSLTCDYAELQSPEVDILAYDIQGAEVGSARICSNCPIILNPAALCPPPSFPTYTFIGPHKIFTGCQDIYDLVLPGGSVIPGVHRVQLTPAFHADLLSDVSSVSCDKLSGDGPMIAGSYRILPPSSPPACDTIDFNADALFPDDSDLIDFLSVLAGGECSTGACNDIDFNNDGLFPDDTDLLAFLRVLAGGTCD